MNNNVDEIFFRDESGNEWRCAPGDDLYEIVKVEKDKGVQDIVIPNKIIYEGTRTIEDKKYDWQKAVKVIKEDLKKYSFIASPKTFGELIEFPEDLTVLTSKQLGQLMSKLEAYRSYVLTQVAFLEVDKLMLQNVFEIGLWKTISLLEGLAPKRRLKESLQAQAIIGNVKLKIVKQKLMEIEAKGQALEKLGTIYNGQIFTISREMSRRQGVEEKF